jgi:hypothetical protein
MLKHYSGDRCMAYHHCVVRAGNMCTNVKTRLRYFLKFCVMSFASREIPVPTIEIKPQSIKCRGHVASNEM